MNEKRLIQISKILSAIFSPFYAPVWAFIGLFMFSFLSYASWEVKAKMIGMVYVFTVFIPCSGINALRILMKWTHMQLSIREHRHLPYILTILSYGTCLLFLTINNSATFFKSILIAALVAQGICVIINIWWKISTHMVGMGGLVGAGLAFSFIFFFNPIYLVCPLLILSGALGTSRIILRQHTVAQVGVGFLVGFVCTMFFILYNWIRVFC